MLDLSLTGKVIKNGRSQLNMTQEQMAEQLHVTKQAVSNWERGINLPDEYIRNEIEALLNITLHQENKMKNT